MKSWVSVGVAMFLGMGSAFALSVPESSTGAPRAGQYTQSVRNPTSLIPNFDVGNIGPIITEMGYSWKTQTTQSGKQFIAATVRNLTIVLLPSACDGGANSGCVGLQTLAYFNGQRLSPGLVWRYNNQSVFSYVGIDGDDTFFVRRYDIADYGVPRGNVEASIQNFRASVDNMMRAFASVGAANEISPPEPDTPLGLVQRRVEEAELLSGARTPVASSHAYLEFVDDNLLDLLTDPAMPSNEVSNGLADDSVEAVVD